MPKPDKKNTVTINEVDMTDKDCQYVGIAYFNDKGQKVTESFVIPNNGIVIKTHKATIKIKINRKPTFKVTFNETKKPTPPLMRDIFENEQPEKK